VGCGTVCRWLTCACLVGPLDKYLEAFQWNEAKYPIKNSIRELTDAIQKARAGAARCWWWRWRR
jgi:hypothetical protein